MGQTFPGFLPVLYQFFFLFQDLILLLFQSSQEGDRFFQLLFQLLLFLFPRFLFGAGL